MDNLKRLYKLGDVTTTKKFSRHNDFLGEYGFLSLDGESFIFTTILGQQIGSINGIEIEETDYGLYITSENGAQYRFDVAYCFTLLEQEKIDFKFSTK